MTDRPTWTLKDQVLPASFPAAQVDRREAMKTALAYQGGYERMKEATDFIQHVLAFHLETAKEAYTDLSVLVSKGQAQSMPGWSLEAFPAKIPGATEFLLTNETGPGGYHVSLRTQPVLAGLAARRVADLKAQIREELEAQGLSDMDIMMREILGAKEPTRLERDLKAVKRVVSNYRDVAAGDTFSDLFVTALDIDGPPPGALKEDTSRLSQIQGQDVDKIYLAGMQIESGPETIPDHDGFLRERSTGRISSSTEIALVLMSQLLEANGQAQRIADRAHDVGQKSWMSFGMPHGAEVMDAAHAAVYGARGLVNRDVLAQITAFSRGLAEHDISLFSGECRTLAESLIAEGYDAADDHFEANDMRDLGHAQRDGDVLKLFTETQHGTYRLDMDFAGTSSVQAMAAFDVSSDSDIPLGRFIAKGGGWKQDYEGILTGQAPIPYDIERIRSMNVMIMSLTSLACVLEDELKDRGDSPEP